MKLTILTSLFLGLAQAAVAANPIYTVKCDEPKGRKADYGSIKDFWTHEEKLRQGEVNWDDGRFEGARPVFVFGEGLGDTVLYTTSMIVYDYIQTGVVPDDLQLFANYESAQRGRIVKASNEGNIWIQFIAPTNHGVGVIALDSGTKSMVYANTDVYAFSSSRAVSSWLFYSNCEWFQFE